MKRFIIAIISVVVIFSLLLVGCNVTSNEATDTTTYAKGTYLFFETDYEQVYLDFLNNFDEKTFEIVDISTSASSSDTEEHDDYFMVTYRVK